MATIDKPKGNPESTMDLLVTMQSIFRGDEPLKTRYLFTIRHYRPENGRRMIYRLTTVGH